MPGTHAIGSPCRAWCSLQKEPYYIRSRILFSFLLFFLLADQREGRDIFITKMEILSVSKISMSKFICIHLMGFLVDWE